MYTRASNAKKHSQVPRRPTRSCSRKIRLFVDQEVRILQLDKRTLAPTEDIWFLKYDRSMKGSIPFALQSEQYLFSSSFSNSDKIVWAVFCFCPLSLCALEDIIKGSGRQKPVYFLTTILKMATTLRKTGLDEPANTLWWCRPCVINWRHTVDVQTPQSANNSACEAK